MPFELLIAALAALLLFLAAFLLLRTAMQMTGQEPVDPAPEREVVPELVAEHLGSVIRCETVSRLEGEEPDRAAFQQLHAALQRWYPRVHEYLVREAINEHSLLYTWKGSRPELPAVLLSAHLDVVPADPASADQWEHPPFAGEVADGYVWGRGALDVKSQVVALLDAVEYLLVEGYWPERTLYLAFGHDEELGGAQGTGAIVAQLAERGERLEAVLDEGGLIAAGTLPGVDGPVALVGTAEKGYLTLKLTVDAPPGHAAMPPRTTAIGRLAEALRRVESRPMPPRLEWVRVLYQSVGSAASFGLQFLMANTWLFGGLLARRLSASPEINAAIRTTAASTLIRGGIKENVLPQRAEAVINMRLMTGDTIAEACEYVRKAVNDEAVQIEAVPEGAWEASPLSPVDAPAFNRLQNAIRRVFGGVPVSPYLVLGATDARRYYALTDQVYRFSPYVLTREDMRRVHGVNERISVAALGKMVEFYILLLQEWTAGEIGAPFSQAHTSAAAQSEDAESEEPEVSESSKRSENSESPENVMSSEGDTTESEPESASDAV